VVCAARAPLTATAKKVRNQLRPAHHDDRNNECPIRVPDDTCAVLVPALGGRVSSLAGSGSWGRR
jgi:hypothetical protein